jgi:hypothetical protein
MQGPAVVPEALLVEALFFQLGEAARVEARVLE